MSPDTTALQTLLEREQTERDALLTEHRQAQTRLGAAQAQAQQLHDYRGEYQQRWSSNFRSAGSVEILRHYQSFSERLTQAIEQQAAVVANTQVQVERLRQALTAQELRVASVRKLIERRVSDARQALERRDQKQTDEAAQRAAWRARGESRHAPLV